MKLNQTFVISSIVLLFSTSCGDSGDVSTVGLAGPGSGGTGGTAFDPGPSGEDGDGETVRVEGEYAVPVSDPALEPFASHPVIVDWRQTQGEYRLDYDFPEDLTGLSQRVSFEGTLSRDGVVEFVGDLGAASCVMEGTPTSLVCTESFPGLAFDLPRLQRDLERRGLPITEIARRLDVASIFASDPIGVLTFALP